MGCSPHMQPNIKKVNTYAACTKLDLDFSAETLGQKETRRDQTSMASRSRKKEAGGAEEETGLRRFCLFF